MPEVEIEVDETLVRQLLDRQYSRVEPGSATAPLTFLAQGWDNAMFRLGDTRIVRLPVRSPAAPLIDNEARWLPVVAQLVPVAIPVPIFVGASDGDYPWPWIVSPWIAGDRVTTLPVPERDQLGVGLAEALIALHQPAPADAPENPYRGVPLADRAAVINSRWGMVADYLGSVVSESVRDLWERGVAARPWPGPPVWVHGDPHPLNLLHDRGNLCGLIDFGDITAGDPASDLASAWWTLNASQREHFRHMVDQSGQYDSAVWQRSAAWAASFLTALVNDQPSRVEFADVITHTVDQLVESAVDL